MKDGDACPECGCGTMRGEVSRAKDRPPILRCSWCYHEAPDEDVMVGPRTPDAKQKRL